jgi:hypothetical protein
LDLSNFPHAYFYGTGGSRFQLFCGAREFNGTVTIQGSSFEMGEK